MRKGDSGPGSPEKQPKMARKPRGKSPLTRGALGCALDAARKQDIDRVEVETPSGAKYTFYVGKSENGDPDRKRWDDLTKQAQGKSK
jgi:hypothetical protein